MLDTLAWQAKYAWRVWQRRKVRFAWVALSLGVSIGAAATAFVVGRATIWRTLPIVDQDQVVRIVIDNRGLGGGFVYANEYPEWVRRQDVFASIGSYQYDAGFIFVETPAGRRKLDALHVTISLLQALGVQPVVGRLFGPADVPSGAPEVAIISERLWRTDFAASPAIVGTRITVATPTGPQPATIVGVVPDGLAFQSDVKWRPDLYRPVTDGPASATFGLLPYGYRHMIGRLRDGASLEAATARLSAIAPDLSPRFPAVRTVHPVPLRDFLFEASRPAVLAVLTSAGLVAVIGLVNAFGVLLLVARSRHAEHRIVAAIGGSLARARSQAVVEGLMLGSAAGLVSMVVPAVLSGVIRRLAPMDVRGLTDVSVSVGVLGVAVVAASAAGVLMVLTARRLSSVGIADVRRQARAHASPTRGRWFRQGAVALQIALVGGLLTTGAQVLDTLRKLSLQDVGVAMDEIAAATTNVSGMGSEPSYRLALQGVIDRIGQFGRVPVAIAMLGPLDPRSGFQELVLPTGLRQTVNFDLITEDFPAVMGVPVVAGRPLVLDDRRTGSVLINRSAARAWFGGPAQAIGAEVTTGRGRHRVVGVLEDFRDAGVRSGPEPALYLSLFGQKTLPVSLHVFTRQRGSTAEAAARLRDDIRGVAPEFYAEAWPLARRYQEQTAGPRFLGTLVTSGALLGICLALAGIYALVAQASRDRSGELSVRTALGAPPRNLVRLLTKDVVLAVAIGTVGSVGLGWLGTALVRPFLFGIPDHPIGAWSAVAAAVFASALVSAWIPARRAARAAWLRPDLKELTRVY